MGGQRQETGEQLEAGHISLHPLIQLYHRRHIRQRHLRQSLLRPLHRPVKDTLNPPHHLT